MNNLKRVDEKYCNNNNTLLLKLLLKLDFTTEIKQVAKINVMKKPRTSRRFPVNSASPISEYSRIP